MLPAWKLHSKFQHYWKEYKHKDLYSVCVFLYNELGLNKKNSIDSVRNNWSKVCNFLIQWEGKK